MHILIADADPAARLMVSSAVQSLGHVCTIAADGPEAWDLFQRVAPDAVITDWDMPGLDGTDLTRRIRAQRDVPYPYVIVLTASTEEDTGLRAMEAGADDFVAKPLRTDELERKLVAAARVTALHRQLHRDAREDALTGLGNRRRLEEDLRTIQDRSERYGHRWCAVMIDLDRFKTYNDTLGHLRGDEALRIVGGALRRTIRTGDSLYRYGGEEFLLLLPEQTLESAALAAERLRAVVEALDLAHPAARRLTVSLGVAGPVTGGSRLETLIKDADEALYAAKAAGRNRVEVAGRDGDGDGDRAIRVLLAADDDDVIRMLLSAIAEHEPTVDLVGTARDADEAIALAQRTRPDVVVLGLQMPGGGGVHAATQIVRHVPDTRIVGLSADDSPAAMLDMGRAGAVGFIVKGAEPAEIIRTIQSAVRY
jgi:two-component system chemotaxis response regulator CheY